jgi:hypothetical protein
MSARLQPRLFSSSPTSRSQSGRFLRVVCHVKKLYREATRSTGSRSSDSTRKGRSMNRVRQFALCEATSLIRSLVCGSSVRYHSLYSAGMRGGGPPVRTGWP